MSKRVLFVDDDEIVRDVLGGVLRGSGFEVTTASNVAEALQHISSKTYEVLLSDLHMPGAGDGLTVVSAMRHANPKAVTLLLSAFPEMNAAAHAILSQADQILVKPIDTTGLIEIIQERLAGARAAVPVVETVATILERSSEECIAEWYQSVQRDHDLMAVWLSREDRCRHLPQVFSDLATRLRDLRPLTDTSKSSPAAAEHGTTRYAQGYSAAMMVEESRILQVSIFNTLQRNLANIDFSILLIQVMTIADEVDLQLRQMMESYTRLALPVRRKALPAVV